MWNWERLISMCLGKDVSTTLFLHKWHVEMVLGMCSVHTSIGIHFAHTLLCCSVKLFYSLLLNHSVLIFLLQLQNSLASYLLALLFLNSSLNLMLPPVILSLFLLLNACSSIISISIALVLSTLSRPLQLPLSLRSLSCIHHILPIIDLSQIFLF